MLDTHERVVVQILVNIFGHGPHSEMVWNLYYEHAYRLRKPQPEFLECWDDGSDIPDSVTALGD